MVVEFAVAAVGFFYWPILYVHLRDILSGPCEFTRKKLALSAVFAVAVAAVSTLAGIAYESTFMLIMLATALMAVILLLLLPKAAKRRTKIKIAILAAYLHIFWQMLPSINVLIIVAELAMVAGLIGIIKIQTKRTRLPEPGHVGSISGLWEVA